MHRACVIFAAGVLFSDIRSSTFLQALLLAVILGFNIYLARDRQSGFFAFNANFVRPNTDLLHRCAAVMLLCGVTFAIGWLSFAIALQDIAGATYRCVMAGLIVILLAPLGLIVEMLIPVVVPLAVAAIFVFGWIAYLFMHAPNPAILFGSFGLDTAVVGDVRTLSHFAVFCLRWSSPAYAVAYLIWTFSIREYRLPSSHELKRS